MENYDNFFIYAKNYDETKDFYLNKIGLKIKFHFPEKGIIGFKVGENEPAIILKDANLYKNGKPTIWFTVANVHEEIKQLTERGIKFISEPFSVGLGMAVEFEDPAGNRFGIVDYKK